MTESERQSFKDDIERLKIDKDKLILELERHDKEHERHGFALQMQHMNERFQNMERLQQKIVSIMATTLNRPCFELDLMPQLETYDHDRKRRLAKIGYFHDDVVGEDNQRGSSHSLCEENEDMNSALIPNMDRVVQLEASLAFWESIAHDVADRLCQELDENISCAQNPDISCIELKGDVQPKFSGIDMNSDPAAAASLQSMVSKKESSKEHVIGSITAAASTRPNDVFWEQFLTENPGSSDTEEARPERKDLDGRRNENKSGDPKFWWNIRNVNNLTEHMGILLQQKKL